MAIDKETALGHLGYMPNRAKKTETRLTELRIARGLQPAQLAKLVPMQLPTLRKYEKGERRIGVTYAPRIAAALRVEVKELYAPCKSPVPSPLPWEGRKTKLDLNSIEDSERLKLLRVWGKLSRDVRIAALLLIEAAANVAEEIPKEDNLSHRAVGP